MFKKRYTEWVPLGSFSLGRVDYIALVKKNKKTSMLKFKTKRTHGNRMFSGCNPYFNVPIDIQAQWDEIISL